MADAPPAVETNEPAGELRATKRVSEAEGGCCVYSMYFFFRAFGMWCWCVCSFDDYLLQTRHKKVGRAVRDKDQIVTPILGMCEKGTSDRASDNITVFIFSPAANLLWKIL